MEGERNFLKEKRRRSRTWATLGPVFMYRYWWVYIVWYHENLCFIPKGPWMTYIPKDFEKLWTHWNQTLKKKLPTGLRIIQLNILLGTKGCGDSSAQICDVEVLCLDIHGDVQKNTNFLWDSTIFNGMSPVSFLTVPYGSLDISLNNFKLQFPSLSMELTVCFAYLENKTR